MANQKDSRCTTGEPETETVGSYVAAGVTKQDCAAAKRMVTEIQDVHVEEFGHAPEWTVVLRAVLSRLLTEWDTEVHPDE